MKVLPNLIWVLAVGTLAIPGLVNAGVSAQVVLANCQFDEANNAWTVDEGFHAHAWGSVLDVSGTWTANGETTHWGYSSDTALWSQNDYDAAVNKATNTFGPYIGGVTAVGQAHAVATVPGQTTQTADHNPPALVCGGG